jgi:hypothetical protein
MQLPHLQVTRAVIQRYARVLGRYGGEWGTRPLVLPNGDFFPDHFAGDQPSLAKLLQRMQQHAGLSDIPVEAVVVPRDPEALTGGGCGSGSCTPAVKGGGDFPRLVDRGDSWLLQVPEAELGHPVVLTTNLARSLSVVFLTETQVEGEVFEPPFDVTADFVAVGLGFGALLLQGSYIYSKSCGGPSIASVTKVGVGELAILSSLFIAMGKHSFRDALRELDTTQRALLEEARDLVESNRPLIAALASDPGRVARGDFTLAEATGWLGRLLAKRRKPAQAGTSFDENLSLDEVEDLFVSLAPKHRSTPPAAPANPARDELKALVSEALDDGKVEEELRRETSLDGRVLAQRALSG